MIARPKTSTATSLRSSSDLPQPSPTASRSLAAVIARINARIDDRQVAPRIARVCLNSGATQIQAGETIADALRRAEIILETARDKQRAAEELAGRMADSMPAEQAIPALEALASRRGPISAAMPLNLIPIGEVLAGSTNG